MTAKTIEDYMNAPDIKINFKAERLAEVHV
jgi:hypothetical protein